MTTGSASPSEDNLPTRARTEPAAKPEAGTPGYGSFGKPGDAEAAPAAPVASAGRNDGSNDNPDEFSEFNKPDAHVQAQPNGEPETPPGTPQRGHVTQNQDPESVVAAKDADADVQRTAWADDDPRYAGGKARATWQENNDKEHHNS